MVVPCEHSCSTVAVDVEKFGIGEVSVVALVVQGVDPDRGEIGNVT